MQIVLRRLLDSSSDLMVAAKRMLAIWGVRPADSDFSFHVVASGEVNNEFSVVGYIGVSPVPATHPGLDTWLSGLSLDSARHAVSHGHSIVFAELHSLFVHPDWRHIHLSSALVNMASSTAVTNRLTPVASVPIHNVAAHHVFSSAGFLQFGTGGMVSTDRVRYMALPVSYRSFGHGQVHVLNPRRPNHGR